MLKNLWTATTFLWLVSDRSHRECTIKKAVLKKPVKGLLLFRPMLPYSLLSWNYQKTSCFQNISFRGYKMWTMAWNGSSKYGLRSNCRLKSSCRKLPLTTLFFLAACTICVKPSGVKDLAHEKIIFINLSKDLFCKTEI